MSEINSPKQGQDEINVQRALWVAVIYTIVAASSVVLAIAWIFRYAGWQVYVMAATTVVSLGLDLASVILIRRGRLVPALKIMYWSGLFTLPINVLLFEGVASFLAAIVIVVGFVNVFYLFPKSWRMRYQFGPLVAAAVMLGIDYINPPFRANLGGASGLFGWVVLAFIIIASLGLAGRLMWTSGHLRNRIIVMMIGVLTPFLLLSTYISVQAERKELEALLLDRAKTVAIAGAATIGNSLEDAIETGALTYDQVFDRRYYRFWVYDPASDPGYDPEANPDPSIFDKYHTAYDAYTDEHWQMLVDSFVTGEDTLYAIPVDINGYLPTHNTSYSSGNGSAATDRTKRLFNDPVGLRAAQNTEPILQQVYPRPGTGEILWDVSAPIYVNGEHWGGFRVGIQLGANQERVIAATGRTIISSTLVILVLAGFSWFLGRYLSDPLERLTTVATQAAEGNLNQHIEIPDRAEISVLAQAFNTMVSQLRELVTSLELRIVDRTRALETSTEVGRRLSTILDQRELVREVVEQVRSAFNYYYTQIYLLDEPKEQLVLVGGTGKAGQTMLEQGHSIPKGRGLVGEAAVNNIPVLVPNVERSIGYEIITAETVANVLERESSESSTKSWYASYISTIFTDIQAFAEHVAQKKAAGDQLPKIGYILYGLNDFLETMKIGAEEAGKFLGLEVEILSADFDPDQGVRLFRKMIAEKKDGVIVTPHFPEKWVEPIQEAVEASIPVLTANLRCPDSASSAWFGQDSYQSGLTLGRELQQALTTAGKTSGKILVASARELHELYERYAGLKRSFQDTAYTLSEFYDAPLDEQQNIVSWEKLVQSHPDIIAAVGLASPDLPSLIKLKKQFNAQWVAAGYDLSVEVLDAIREGIVHVTIGQHPYLQGYLPILALAEHLVDGTSLDNWIVDGWQSNPLLPETRAEVAIPIAIGENVLGVLDVQDDEIDGLGENDVDLLQSIANQVAVALQNARLYQHTQQQVAREALIANINQQIRETTDMEDALKVAVRELGRALVTDARVSLRKPESGNGQK